MSRHHALAATHAAATAAHLINTATAYRTRLVRQKINK